MEVIFRVKVDPTHSELCLYYTTPLVSNQVSEHLFAIIIRIFPYGCTSVPSPSVQPVSTIADHQQLLSGYTASFFFGLVNVSLYKKIFRIHTLVYKTPPASSAPTRGTPVRGLPALLFISWASSGKNKVKFLRGYSASFLLFGFSPKRG